MNKKIYTHEEMQDRVADYCFGNLKDDELKIFKNSISHYDDIAAEINEMQTAFQPELKAQLNDFMEYKARNLSIGVNEVLNKKEIKKKYTFVKYLAPTFALVLIFLIIYVPIIKVPSKSDNIIQQKELSSLADSVNSEELIMTVADQSPYIDFDFIADLDDFSDDDIEVYDDIVLSEFFDELDNQINEFNGIDLNDDDLYTIINNLDDNDFQQFFEELKNAKI